MRKGHRLGVLSTRCLFPSGPGGWNSDIQVQADSSWGLSPGRVDGRLLPWSLFPPLLMRTPVLLEYTVVQLVTRVTLIVTPWTAAPQASLSLSPRVCSRSCPLHRDSESQSRSVVSDSLPPHGLYTVHGILQARILEWVVFPFSSGSSQPRDRIQVSPVAGGFFTSWTTREAQKYSCG